MRLQKFRRVPVAVGLALALTFVTGAGAQEKDKEAKKDRSPSISVMDSTEAQWGRRSINDSIYRGYTVNAVYLERGRQRLPDSFHMYKPKPIDESNVVQSGSESPTTIRVNGSEQSLSQE